MQTAQALQQAGVKISFIPREAEATQGWYGVENGRVIGVFKDPVDATASISGFRKNNMQGFPSFTDALKFVYGDNFMVNRPWFIHFGGLGVPAGVQAQMMHWPNAADQLAEDNATDAGTTAQATPAEPAPNVEPANVAPPTAPATTLDPPTPTPSMPGTLPSSPKAPSLSMPDPSIPFSSQSSRASKPPPSSIATDDSVSDVADFDDEVSVITREGRHRYLMENAILVGSTDLAYLNDHIIAYLECHCWSSRANLIVGALIRDSVNGLSFIHLASRAGLTEGEAKFVWYLHKLA